MERTTYFHNRVSYGAGSGGRLRGCRRPARALGVPVLAVALAVAAVSATGCASLSKQMQSYLQDSQGYFNNVTAAGNALNNYWNMPLAEQEGVSKALADFHKAISKVQEWRDKTDPPEPARDLDRLLGLYLERGRELANMSSQSADYLGSLAPVAAQTGELVAELSKLEEQQDVTSGLTTMADKGKQLYNAYMAVMAPEDFKEVHRLFGDFLVQMNKAFDKALNIAPSVEQQQGTSTPGQEGTQPSRPAGRESYGVVSTLKDIPDDWGRVNGQISAELDGVRTSEGLKTKRGEFESYVGQIQAQIDALKKKYR